MLHQLAYVSYPNEPQGSFWYTRRMRQFIYRKLVRDDILTQMQSMGANPKYRTLNDQEYLSELHKKIIEEASEIKLDDNEKLLSELADLQEVIDCMIVALGKTRRQLQDSRNKKTAKFGSFNNRVFIDTVAMPDDYPWIKYLESNAERYPEIHGNPKA